MEELFFFEIHLKNGKNEQLNWLVKRNETSGQRALDKGSIKPKFESMQIR